MEFPKLGKNCSLAGCGQLAEAKVLSANVQRRATSFQSVDLCPTCKSMILSPSGMTTEETLKSHQASNCVSHLLSSFPRESKRCAISSCKPTTTGGRLPIVVVCDGCGDGFCLRHRHATDHGCSSINAASEETAERRARIDEILKHIRNNANKSASSTAMTPRTNNKPKKTSKLVELMKMKSKATGDSSIPHESRLYLNVGFPKDTNVTTKPMFFDKSWVIGKVLDKIATAGKIRNVNNKMDVSKNERLILVDQETNSILNVDDRLGDAIESGGGVLLEREGVINQ
ncbi:11436_t:CDS:2 [Paraglomus brasilianum]|uniref:11436_t:CDS:1 n=1 Tax=Paraglomus brasilianum TaxID=144538 RepID=A0A9N9ANJ9_9GLOM|nr:11436_t:CDS:2 [Paraglomus brasilianum]